MRRRRDESSAAPGAGLVRLNVGGTIYTTTLDTLRAVPDSLFGRMFDPDLSLSMVPTDEDGNIFFDRDPEVFRWVLDFLRRRGRSVGMPRRELIPLLRDEADYFGLVGLVEACEADQAPEPIVAMLHEGFSGLDEGFAGVITALGTLAERISDDPAKSVTKVLSGIEQSLDNMPDCSPINYTDELEQISADIDQLTRRIYDPENRHGPSLVSAIANR